jgi:hypothetical protein
LIQFSRYYTDGVDEERPNADALKASEETYSNWKLKDLATEYTNQYPQLETLFSIWGTKFFRRKYHLTRAEIDEMILILLVETPINERWFNELVDNVDTLGMLKILYEIGFIGDFVKGGDRGSKTLYSFRDQHKPVFEEIQVHPCFRKAVGTVERIRTKDPNKDISETPTVEPAN